MNAAIRPKQWNDPQLQAGENQAYSEGLAAFKSGRPVSQDWLDAYGAQFGVPAHLRNGGNQEPYPVNAHGVAIGDSSASGGRAAFVPAGGPKKWSDPQMQAGENKAYAEGLSAYRTGQPVSSDWMQAYGPKGGRVTDQYDGGASIAETPCGDPGPDPGEVQQALDKLNNNGPYQPCCGGTTTTVPPTGPETSPPFPTRNCVVKFSNATNQDIRFVDKWGSGWADPGVGGGVLNPQRHRMLVTLSSASADPVCIVAGGTGTAYLLHAWDSPTPSNFGGDGHSWWRLYYVVPSTNYIDFTGTTGAFRQCTFIEADRDLGSMGARGDGVEINSAQQLAYTGSHVHFDTESVSVDQSSIYGDFVWLFLDGAWRTIDNTTQQKFFHCATVPFNHDYGPIFNSQLIPLNPGGGQQSSIDWTMDSKNDAFLGHTFTMGETNTATDNGTFPNSTRCLATAASVRLRGLCQQALLA